MYDIQMAMDPIDAIPTYGERSAFIEKLMTAADKMPQKDVQIIKKHKFQLNYILSLYEIIEATRNRTNFEVLLSLLVFSSGLYREEH